MISVASLVFIDYYIRTCVQYVQMYVCHSVRQWLCELLSASLSLQLNGNRYV